MQLRKTALAAILASVIAGGAAAQIPEPAPCPPYVPVNTNYYVGPIGGVDAALLPGHFGTPDPLDVDERAIVDQIAPSGSADDVRAMLLHPVTKTSAGTLMISAVQATPGSGTFQLIQRFDAARRAHGMSHALEAARATR